MGAFSAAKRAAKKPTTVTVRKAIGGVVHTNTVTKPMAAPPSMRSPIKAVHASEQTVSDSHFAAPTKRAVRKAKPPSSMSRGRKATPQEWAKAMKY